MNRYLIIFILMVALSISGVLNPTIPQANNSANKKQIITREQAAELASKLANEKFQKDFGVSPFNPESYTAELIGNRWYWGKIDPVGINGCSTKVEFNKDGSSPEIKVAYHTDKNINPPIIFERPQKQNKLPDIIKTKQ